MYLIIGLGNPGPSYELTRHNAGFRALQNFQKIQSATFSGWKKKFDAEISEGNIDGKKVILFLPQTFMNNSGDAVIQAINFWHIDLNNVIIVYDDADIPLGTLRIRPDGSAGGHNGIRSIIERLGKENITRIRIGIGTEMEKTIPREDFVLQKFSSEEETQLQKINEKVAAAISTLIIQGIGSAMNDYNQLEK